MPLVNQHAGLARTRWGFAIALLAAAALAGCSRACGGPAAPAQAAPRRVVATCESAVGTVQFRGPGQDTFQRASFGSGFRVGDLVQTGSLSTARIEFAGGGGLEMEEHSAVVIDVEPPSKSAPEWQGAAGENRVGVKAGVVRGFLPEVPEGAKPRWIVVTAPDGSRVIMGSRPGDKGATFRLSSKDNGAEIAMLEGAAAVRGASGETMLRAGQLALASGGDLAGRAELIAFPQSLEPAIDAHVPLAPGLGVKVSWREVPGATGYRVQVASDLSFRSLELVQDVQRTEIAFQPRAPGMRVWRVASRDAAGRYGEYGFARRLFCDEALPQDLLLEPADGTAVKLAGPATQVAFSWQAMAAARSYRIVLASGPNLLEGPVSSKVVSEPRGALEIAAAGDYWWGVYVESGVRPFPIFTKPRRLSVVKVHKPKLDVPRAITRWGS